MRGIWVAVLLLLAIGGGVATGFSLNEQYGFRLSPPPARTGIQEDLTISVRRLSFVGAQKPKPATPPARSGTFVLERDSNPQWHSDAPPNGYLLKNVATR